MKSIKNLKALALAGCLAGATWTPLVAQADTTEELPTVHVQGDYVSFDDIVTLLNGTMETEAEQERTYHVQDKVFNLSPSQQVSWVNSQVEPYQLTPSLVDTTILNLVALYPVVYEDDYFTPISYVERLLHLTYRDQIFEKDDEPIAKGENLVDADISTTPSDTVTDIWLETDSLELTIGETMRVQSMVNPFTVSDTSVTWIPFDESIVEVSEDGMIKGLQMGETTILVASVLTPNVTREIAVSVIGIYPTQVEVGAKTYSLTTGQSKQLTAYVLPSNATNPNLTYTSNNAEVATVNASGKVTAISEGTATIIVTAEADKSIQTTVTINVSNPAPTPTPTPEEPTTPTQPDSGNTGGDSNTSTPPSTQPTYTGWDDVSWATSNGWYSGNGREGAYLNEIDATGSFDSDKAEFFSNSAYKSGDEDSLLLIYDYRGDYKSSVDSLIWHMLPSNGGALISKLSSGSSGTFQWDGRKVVVTSKGYGWHIQFHAKY